MRKSIFIVAMALLFLFFPQLADGMGNPFFDPSAQPGLPSQLPPLIPLTPPPQPPPEDTTQPVIVNYDLPAGWSVISFPLAHLDSASGFTHMLLYYAAGNYYPLDPVHSPTSINPRLAYLAYSKTPVKAQVSGLPNVREVRSIALASGWNLIGCPFPQKLYWHRITFSCEQATRVLETAAGPSLGPSGKYWISSSAFDVDGGSSSRNLLAPAASLDPLRGLWVFVWHPLLLNLNLLVPPSPPQISTLKPRSVCAGDTIEINGSGFSSFQGWIALGGIPIPRDNILSWSDRRIQVRIPPTAQPGDIIVLVESFPSNPVPLAVTPAVHPSIGGTLIGKVQNYSGDPLKGAQVLLDSGQSAISLNDGTYVLTGISPGPHLLSTTLLGYREATGQVVLEPSSSKSVLISLSPLFTAAGPVANMPPPGGIKNVPSPTKPPEEAKTERGTLNIVADSYNDGYHRWWVKRIEVHALGDYSLRWEKSWDSDLGDTWYELDCDDAAVGMTYRIKIDWKRDGTGSPLTNTWDRTMRSADQTETFDSPY